MTSPAKGVRVRPAMVELDGETKPAPLRNPYRAQAVMAPEGELLPFNAWLLRRVRKGDLVPIDDKGNPVGIDDLGNVIAPPAAE